MVDAGNASPISLEVEFTQAGPKNLAEVDKAVKDSFDYLKGLGVVMRSSRIDSRRKELRFPNRRGNKCQEDGR